MTNEKWDQAEIVRAALAAINRHCDRCDVCNPGPGNCKTWDRLQADINSAIEAGEAHDK